MDSKASSSIVRLKCDALMHLYDSKQIDGGFATSISAMAGEELGLALIEHYFNKNGIAAKRVIGVPTTGMKSGYRLDGWIKTDSVLYQVEVKNWGANAIGGKVYNGNYKAGWDQFVAWFRNPGLQKVLFKMRAPANLKNIYDSASGLHVAHYAPRGCEASFFQSARCSIAISCFSVVFYGTTYFFDVRVFASISQ